jgi:hypothetical protein
MAQIARSIMYEYNQYNTLYVLHRTLQRTNTINLIQIFQEKELRGPQSQFHIHVSVSDLYIPTIDLLFLLQEICGPILGIYKLITDTNVETGTEAAQFQEKEYINGIFVAV